MGKTESICSLSDLSEFYGKDMATRDAYGITLVELGKKNPDIVVLDADLSCSTKTAKFAKVFPDRFFNMGISEQDMIGTAAGLALTGKIPFASTFAIFATGRAWEQIRQTVCYSNANVKDVATNMEELQLEKMVQLISIRGYCPHACYSGNECYCAFRCI